jgi:hypothetical protein
LDIYAYILLIWVGYNDFDKNILKADSAVTSGFPDGAVNLTTGVYLFVSEVLCIRTDW